MANSDKKRLDWLDSLMRRTQFQTQKRPAESVGTDIHIHADRIAIYLRSLTADVAGQGHGKNIRTAIDAAMGETHEQG